MLKLQQARDAAKGGNAQAKVPASREALALMQSTRAAAPGGV